MSGPLDRTARWLTGRFSSLRERVTGLLSSDREAAELDEELRFHLEMEAERLVGEEGLDPGEARRRAAVSFGGVERTKEDVRDARGLGWLTGWWLDVKLGLRMLIKYPALTILGSLSMAFAIFAGATAFEVISQVVSPALPLPDGDRVVAIELWDAAGSRTERRVLYDLAVWQENVETVRDVGTFQNLRRNLVASDGYGAPVMLAAMSAAGFRVAGVSPILGRALAEADEVPGAPPVVVIGYDVWRDRFAGDPSVIGTETVIGGTPTTVVGVMPEGFGFPLAHDVWIPFGRAGQAFSPLEGPGVLVFGRLAPGASLEDARAELRVLGSRMAADFPDTHEHLRPQVSPWATSWLGASIGGADPTGLSTLTLMVLGAASNLPLALFLILVCGNVALLLFARATSREGELVVRSALGASRRRIILQLFVEALVLAALAAVIGLLAARYAIAWLFRITELSLFDEGLPFWFDASLSPVTLLYAALLTVLAAGVAGILPGLKVTRDLRPGLQRATAGGGGFRFGGVWTVVIVLQIAVTMIFPLITLAVRSEGSREVNEDLDLPAREYLSARLELQRPAPLEVPEDSAAVWTRRRMATTLDRLAQRIGSEPGVRGVAFTERLPREYHPWRQVEVDGPTAEPPDERGHRLGSARVAINYFDVMSAEVIAGRGLRLADLEEGQRAVVVNESFVERVMGGRNPVGLRVRYLASEEYRDPSQEPGPWHEIVGVVEDLGTVSGYGHQGMYHPAEPGDIHPVRAAIHVSGNASAFGPTLRGIAMEVEPTLILQDIQDLAELTRTQREFYTFWSTVLGAVSGLAILLSMGGIFAVMSFTMARRTREIGIRVALGASATRVVAAVFRKPLTQVALGIGTGAALLGILPVAFGENPPDLDGILFLLGYISIMAAVCLLACIPPTRRALAVEPAEALKAEG